MIKKSNKSQENATGTDGCLASLPLASRAAHTVARSIPVCHAKNAEKHRPVHWPWRQWTPWLTAYQPLHEKQSSGSSPSAGNWARLTSHSCPTEWGVQVGLQTYEPKEYMQLKNMASSVVLLLKQKLGLEFLQKLSSNLCRPFFVTPEWNEALPLYMLVDIMSLCTHWM